MLRFNRLANAFNPQPPTSSLICSGEGDDDAGGGGGGGDGDGSLVLDDDGKRFLANTVNSAVSSFMKRDSFRDSIASAVGAAMEGFKPAADPTPTPEPTPTPDSSTPDPRDIELAKMKTEQEKMRREMEAQKDSAAAEKKKSRDQVERSKLSDALRLGGVDDARLPGAVAHLYLDAKRVKRNEDDAVCFSFKREWGEELVPVEAGIEEFLKTDSGKVYLPPVEAEGSGNKGGRPPRRKPGEKVTRGELMTKLGSQLMERSNQ